MTGKLPVSAEQETQIQKNMRILKTVREDPGWALSRILLAERLQDDRPKLLHQIDTLKTEAERAYAELQAAQEREQGLADSLELAHRYIDALEENKDRTWSAAQRTEEAGE